MVEVTEANAREAGAAAARLLRDPYLAETLDEMVSAATQTAIFSEDAEARESARCDVLAIFRLRTNLQATMDNWQTAAQTLLRAKAHE
jgi:hypothetical protein